MSYNFGTLYRCSLILIKVSLIIPITQIWVSVIVASVLLRSLIVEAITKIVYLIVRNECSVTRAEIIGICRIISKLLLMWNVSLFPLFLGISAALGIF